MPKSDIPVPVCTTCGISGEEQHKKGETFYLCENCGTELRYRPAGELLNSGSKKAIENNGWAMSFSVQSSEIYSGQAMFVLGIVVVLLTLLFLWTGRLETDAALWSAGSGIILAILGKRKSTKQQKKNRTTLAQYPYWNR